MLKCKVGKLAVTVFPLIKEDIPVMLHGRSGIGKSEITGGVLCNMIRAEYGSCVLHDYRLSSMDTVDMTGVPKVDGVATIWTRPAVVPEDDGQMHVFFFDEITHASMAVAHAAYQFIHDRKAGDHRLPKKNRILAACNIREDKGGDNKLPKPLENRMAHIQVDLDPKSWQEWANEHKIDPRLCGLIKTRPELLHNMSDNPAWPSPRAWERVNRILVSGYPSDVIQDMATAIVGEGAAMQLVEWLKSLGAGLPRLADILINPTKAKVPTELNHQYVIASAISRNADLKTAEVFSKYLTRLPPDLASMASHDGIQRDPTLKDIKAWAALRM